MVGLGGMRCLLWGICESRLCVCFWKFKSSERSECASSAGNVTLNIIKYVVTFWARHTVCSVPVHSHNIMLRNVEEEALDNCVKIFNLSQDKSM